ncbi:hypothetical protein KA017_03820 [Candidatus Woesebacteria bacterium]|nr:hypothetical protein [Candidatus Woesebacteria bacterium]
MTEQLLTFDQVFAIWLINEVGNPGEVNLLPLANDKGFDSVSEWRLNTALRLGLDKKEWSLIEIEQPTENLPKIIVGPYQGWSKFFENKLTTSFLDALELPEFFQWCKEHDRIPNIAENFPTPTTLILLQKSNGEYICIEGGHRVCAVAYANKIGMNLDIKISAAVADISDDEIEKLIQFLKDGTNKQSIK